MLPLPPRFFAVPFALDPDAAFGDSLGFTAVSGDELEAAAAKWPWATGPDSLCAEPFIDDFPAFDATCPSRAFVGGRAGLATPSLEAPLPFDGDGLFLEVSFPLSLGGVPPDSASFFFVPCFAAAAV